MPSIGSRPHGRLSLVGQLLIRGCPFPLLPAGRDLHPLLIRIRRRLPPSACIASSGTAGRTRRKESPSHHVRGDPRYCAWRGEGARAVGVGQGEARAADSGDAWTVAVVVLAIGVAAVVIFLLLTKR
jgi:hypothetical protein